MVFVPFVQDMGLLRPLVLTHIPDLGVGTDPECFGVGPDRVDVATWVKLRTSHRLNVIQRGDWHKLWFPQPCQTVTLQLFNKTGKRI